MTTIRAHFDGKTFIPDEPVQAAVNQAVTILMPAMTANNASLTDEAFERILAEMEEDSVVVPQTVDWSRDSVYSGTLSRNAE